MKIKIDTNALGQIQARCETLEVMGKSLNNNIKEVNARLARSFDNMPMVFLGHKLANAFSWLGLEVRIEYLGSSYMAPVSLIYKVGSEGLTPLVPLMKALRKEFGGTPDCIRDEKAMTIEWNYGNGPTASNKLKLRIEPGPEAKCERVKVGEEEIEVSEHERTRPIYEIRCEGAEAFGELMGKDKAKIDTWAEEATGATDGVSEESGS